MRVNTAKSDKANKKKKYNKNQIQNCLGKAAHNLSRYWYYNYNKKTII